MASAWVDRVDMGIDRADLGIDRARGEGVVRHDGRRHRYTGWGGCIYIKTGRGLGIIDMAEQGIDMVRPGHGYTGRG